MPGLYFQPLLPLFFPKRHLSFLIDTPYSLLAGNWTVRPRNLHLKGATARSHSPPQSQHAVADRESIALRRPPPGPASIHRKARARYAVSMDHYQNNLVAQREDTALSQSPSPSIYIPRPSLLYPIYSLSSSATTTRSGSTASRMESQPIRSWRNLENTTTEGLQAGLPSSSPQQTTFTEYWRQKNPQGAPVPQARRHSSSTPTALSSGNGATDTPIRPNATTSLSTSSSHTHVPSSFPIDPSIHHHASAQYLVPQLHHTATLCQDHGVSTFSSIHHMSFSPSADTVLVNGNADYAWPSGHSPVESRPLVLAPAQHAMGAAFEPSTAAASLPLWHGISRPGLLLPSFPRWNPPLPSSSTWVQHPTLDNVSQPPIQTYGPPMSSSSGILQPPATTPVSSHLPTSYIPTTGRPDAVGYAYPARVPVDVVPTSRDTAASLNRTVRPPVIIRRRSSLSAAVSGTNVVKRKPLPKIYGCSGCGKKFDRPSTLKVVRCRFPVWSPSLPLAILECDPFGPLCSLLSFYIGNISCTLILYHAEYNRPFLSCYRWTFHCRKRKS